MKFDITICPKEDLGPLTPNEEYAYDQIVKWFSNHHLETVRRMLNASTRGWNTVAHWGACYILGCNALRGRLFRFQPAAYPWVPPGEMWPDQPGTDTYMTRWRIDFRAMTPMEHDE